MLKDRNLVDLLKSDVRGDGEDTGRQVRAFSTGRGSGFKRIFFVVLVLITIFSVGSAFYFYRQYENLKIKPVVVQQAEDEIKTILAAVGKLIVLPKGETPTVATVADPSQLRDQPFFANAKKGDRVLIYSDARKAILYSQSENKIIEVAPINFQNPLPPAEPTSTKK